jgi:hypothetical protein
MEELKLRLDFLHELKIEVLLFVDDTLTEMQNLQIFHNDCPDITYKICMLHVLENF